MHLFNVLHTDIGRDFPITGICEYISRGKVSLQLPVLLNSDMEKICQRRMVIRLFICCFHVVLGL